MGSRHLVSTTPGAHTCPRCTAPVLSAWAEGVRAVVDAQPIPANQEITAIINGLTTYSLVAGELVYRDEHRIADTTRHHPIHVQHRCTGNVQTTIDDML